MILHGDCRERLRELDPGSVQCCVTSPPYWGLRDYGTATWEGGQEGCDHLQRPVPADGDDPGLRCSTLNNARNGGNQTITAGARAKAMFRDLCGKCGARRVDQQLGLEPTPEAYVANMVEVFRLVRDVLAEDGTLWLNLGDSYANDGKWGGETGGKQAYLDDVNRKRVGREKRVTGLKPKDLVGIPWRVAFALQAAGWYLRSDIIWAKPNQMPESVTDRPTKAHEYLFLLSKRERYYYDAEAIAEPAAGGRERFSGDQFGNKGLDNWGRNDHGRVDTSIATDRNRRSVWTIATQPYAEAHFATFPPALVEPCIAAGSRTGDVVLDPFGGSGTVGEVAQRLGRRYILIELNEKYLPLIERRTAQQGLALA